MGCPAGVSAVTCVVPGGDRSFATSAGRIRHGSSFYTDGFLHADDIRTLASNVSSMEEQVAMVQEFAR